MSKWTVTVVLPTYNERENIKVLIPNIIDVLETNKIEWKILVVDDNSPDGTADAVREMNKKNEKIKVLLREKKEGLGAALKDAYNNCKTDIIISMDSDLSLSPSYIPEFLQKIEDGYDLVIGSKYSKLSRYEKTKSRTFIQSVLSQTANTFIKFLIGIDITDFTLNYRCFKRDMLKKIDINDKRNAFFLEMIVEAKYSGFKIAEIPIVFKERRYGKTKTNIFSLGINLLSMAFVSFFKYRIMHRKISAGKDFSQTYK